MRRIAIPALCLALLAPWPARAATKSVAVTDNAFGPATIGIRRGGEVAWLREGTGNPHNIASDDGLFRSGDAVSGAIEYRLTFSAGSFPFFCEIHGGPGGSGMAGVVRVRAIAKPAPAGRSFTVLWSTKGSDVAGTFDVQYRRGRKGSWATWLDATARRKGVFGAKGRPARVRRAAYFFRVRTLLTGVGQSDWSPPVRFRA